MELRQNIDSFVKSAGKLGFLNSLKEKAEKLEEKLSTGQLNLVVVGEFSSGKTSLINKLYNLNLPTDIYPKTASIWKIITSNESSKYIVNFEDEQTKEFERIEELENIPPEKIKFIEAYVKSDLAEGIIIVDTPGLSSIEERHRKILENFINEADILLIAIDINQGLTKTTQEFINQNFGEKDKTFVILTKSDTKPLSAIDNLKKHIEETSSDFISKVISTSSKDNNLEELKKLLAEISEKKEKYLIEIVSKRLGNLCKEAYHLVSFQIKNTDLNVDELNQKERELKRQLEKVEDEIESKQKELNRRIDKTIENANETFIKTLWNKKEWIIEGLYDDNLEKGIEDRFNKAIEISATMSIAEIEKELKKLSEDFAQIVNELKREVNIGEDFVIFLANQLVRFEETVNGLLNKIMLSLLKDELNRLAFIEHLLPNFVKMITKTFVDKRVSATIKNIEENEFYKNKITPIIKNRFEEFWKETLADLEQTYKNYQKAIEDIKKEKNEKEEEFVKYTELLKTLQEEFKNCGGLNS